MGLDVGFYSEQSEELLALRNHYWLLERFLEQPHEKVETYDDFYVTRAMVLTVLETVEAEMREAGMPLPKIDDDDLLLPDDMLKDIPDGFCDEEPEEWPDALAPYRLLVTRLLYEVQARYVLICGWSA